MGQDVVTAEQRERLAVLCASGYSTRGAAEALAREGMPLGKSAINEEYKRIRSGAPVPPQVVRAPPPLITVSPRAPTRPEPLPLPTIDEGEREERDPTKLAERDWLWYEEEILRVRSLARQMFELKEYKHYNDLLAKAEKLERRAKELRPPAPPNPDKDPTYRAEARRLENYLEALVSAAEQGQPLPERTLPPTEAIAA